MEKVWSSHTIMNHRRNERVRCGTVRWALDPQLGARWRWAPSAYRHDPPWSHIMHEAHKRSKHTTKPLLSDSKESCGRVLPIHLVQIVAFPYSYPVTSHSVPGETNSQRGTSINGALTEATRSNRQQELERKVPKERCADSTDCVHSQTTSGAPTCCWPDRIASWRNNFVCNLRQLL